MCSQPNAIKYDYTVLICILCLNIVPILTLARYSALQVQGWGTVVDADDTLDCYSIELNDGCSVQKNLPQGEFRWPLVLLSSIQPITLIYYN